MTRDLAKVVEQLSAAKATAAANGDAPRRISAPRPKGNRRQSISTLRLTISNAPPRASSSSREGRPPEIALRRPFRVVMRIQRRSLAGS